MVTRRLHLDIDGPSYERLVEMAIQCRRPIAWQAEVLLMQVINETYMPSLRSDGEAVDERQDIEAPV